MKMPALNYELLLKWILWLIALHSIGFGISLIVLPVSVIEWFGFRLEEKFFAVQGGVFHLVVSIAYIMAALDLKHSSRLIILSCSAKFSATLFLISYYLFEKQIFMVLFSGIADGFMGLAIWIVYLLYRKTLSVKEKHQ
ncbi:MAG: hypothetical protein Q8867_09450 [Bacteroidota bacterium]|nr:hypothetical protein [Bacteroidota bacterium]